MHQLKVLRCEVCHAPFLFESSLEDHKRDHALKENDHAFVESKRSSKKRLHKRKSRTKRKRSS